MTIDNIPNTAMVMTLQGQLKKLRGDIIIAEGKQKDNTARAEEIGKAIAGKQVQIRKLEEECQTLDKERIVLLDANKQAMLETEKKREYFMKLQAKVKKATAIRSQLKELLSDMGQEEKDALLTEMIFEANTVNNQGNYTLSREPDEVDAEEEAFFNGDFNDTLESPDFKFTSSLNQ